jgi:hypothetical protein
MVLWSNFVAVVITVAHAVTDPIVTKYGGKSQLGFEVARVRSFLLIL